MSHALDDTGSGGYGSHPSEIHSHDAEDDLAFMDLEALDARGRRMRNIAIAIIACFYGTMPLTAAGAYFFFGNTVMMYNPPKGTMVAKTNALSNTVFRTQVFHDPVFILLESQNSSVPVYEAGGGALCEITDFAASFQDPTFTHVIGYCPYARVGAMFVARDFVTADNQSSLLVADFVLTSTVSKEEGVQNRLMDGVRDLVHAKYADSLRIKFASVGLVSGDLVHGLVGDLLKIDVLSIPIAMLALALCLRSIRMLIVPGIVLPVVMCLAFSVSYLVSLGIEVSAFAPEMTSATMVAITIDYSLFILSRFLELAPRFETEYGGDTPHVRFVVCRETAKRCAHNIGVSGMTIGVALGGLILMPVKFIGSIGYIFFVACVAAVVVSLTLMPSILLVFYGFFRHETDFAAPWRWIQSKFKGDRETNRSEADEPVTARDRGLMNDSTPAKPVGSRALLLDHAQSTGAERVNMGSASFMAHSAAYSDVEKDLKNVDPMGSANVAESAAFDAKLRAQQYDSWWFKIGLFSYRHPWPVIIAVLAFGAPFFWLTSQIEVNFDLFQQVPTDSPHAKTLKYILNNIGHGQAAPFYITMDTGRAGTITLNASNTASAHVFERAVALSIHLNAHVSQGLERFNSFAVVEGIPCDVFMADFFYEKSADYRVLWNNTVDATGRAGIIRLTVDFDPFSADANAFLNKLNAGIQSFDTQGAFEIGLMGASSTSWAIMQKVMDLFPLQIGITFAIIFVLIALVFRSVFVPFRMVLTVSYTVAVSLGAGVLMFQYDWSHAAWTEMKGVTSYAWTVPIFAFSLLCALALDYDVFLLTRLVEMHEHGYAADAAMAKAVWRTGRIISFAGIIMAVSFGSMVFSDIIMLNQFGFICAFAVMLDTFVIRSLFVPALMSIHTRVAWWPRKFPDVALGMDDMKE